jgi:hypothetical protein
MARVNEELQGSRAAALRCPPGLWAHSNGGRWGTKKTCVFLLENLVKFGKFQQNLENMVQKNMGCSNLNDLVKKKYVDVE